MLTRVHKHSQGTIPKRDRDESKECLGTNEGVFYHFQNYVSKVDFTYREPEISSFDSYD